MMWVGLRGTIAALAASLGWSVPALAQEATPPAPVAPRSLLQLQNLLPTLSSEAPDRGYRLRKKGDGSYHFDGDNWTAEIAADGSVSFSDSGARVTHAYIGRWSIGFRADAPRAALSQSGIPSVGEFILSRLRPHQPPSLSQYHADPREVCRPSDGCYVIPSGSTVGVVGRFDVTDSYMRWLRQDPYRPEKARFLAATSELRLELARKARTEQLRRIDGGVPAALLKLWSNSELPPVDKRRLLFELWIDGDTDGPSSVRSSVIGFIRAKLPSGSADAYSQQELEHYGKLSSGAFAPYAE